MWILRTLLSGVTVAWLVLLTNANVLAANLTIAQALKISQDTGHPIFALAGTAN